MEKVCTMTAIVPCTNVRFPEFAEVEESEAKRDFLIAHFHRLGDISMVKAIEEEPVGSSYIDCLYQLISSGGTTEE